MKPLSNLPPGVSVLDEHINPSGNGYIIEDVEHPDMPDPPTLESSDEFTALAVATHKYLMKYGLDAVLRALASLITTADEYAQMSDLMEKNDGQV